MLSFSLCFRLCGINAVSIVTSSREMLSFSLCVFQTVWKQCCVRCHPRQRDAVMFSLCVSGCVGAMMCLLSLQAKRCSHFLSLFQAVWEQCCVDCHFRQRDAVIFPLCFRLCGSNVVSAVTSGREMLLRFVSDSSSEFAGFQAQVASTIPGIVSGVRQCLQ